MNKVQLNVSKSVADKVALFFDKGSGPSYAKASAGEAEGRKPRRGNLELETWNW
jgi:hypothetical protein